MRYRDEKRIVGCMCSGDGDGGYFRFQACDVRKGAALLPTLEAESVLALRIYQPIRHVSCSNQPYMELM
jgi:hypothetical protein